MKVMERLAGMSDEEYEKEMALYQYPLFIDGTRYLFYATSTEMCRKCTRKR